MYFFDLNWTVEEGLLPTGLNRSLIVHPHGQVNAGKPGGVLRRDGRLDADAFTGTRVVKGKSPGMQHETARFGFLPLGVGVDGIPNQRMPQVQHVDAYLMGAAGVQRAHDQGGVG